MANISTADLATDTNLLSTEQLVGRVANTLGRKLTAYIGSVKDVRAVDRWIAGAAIYGDAEKRLQLTSRLIQMLRVYDSDG